MNTMELENFSIFLQARKFSDIVHLGRESISIGDFSYPWYQAVTRISAV